VQDQKTCVVYGMPRVAVEMGAVESILPLDKIAEHIVKSVGRSEEHTSELHPYTTLFRSCAGSENLRRLRHAPCRCRDGRGGEHSAA